MAYWPYRVGLRWPPCQVTVPFVYDESLSVVEQIGVLFGIVKQFNDNNEQFVTKDVFQQYVDFMEQDQIDQTAMLKNYTDDQLEYLRSQLEDMIRDITVGSVIVYDPSTGFKEPIEEALSKSYNDLRSWAMTWDEWQEVTQDSNFDTWDKVDDFTYNGAIVTERGYSNIRCMDLYNRIVFKGIEYPK